MRFMRVKCPNGYRLIYGQPRAWSVLNVPLTGDRAEQARQLRAARREFRAQPMSNTSK